MTGAEATSAERSVLGAVLLDASTFDTLALRDDQFGDPRNRAVWRAATALRDLGSPVDTVTLEGALRTAGVWDATGGGAYLAELAMAVPTAANAEHYAAIVRKASLTRAVAIALSEVQARIKAGEVEGDDALGEALSCLSRLNSEQPDGARSVWEVVQEQIKAMERAADARLRGETVLVGIPTRLEKLDRIIGGLQPGIGHVIAARPRVGKSSLGLAIASGVSEGGHGVHVFSLEDPMRRYGRRTLSRESRVAASKMQSGTFVREDMQRLSSAAMRLRARTNWIIDDRSGITAEEIVRSVRRRRRDNKTRVVIVDYLQLVRSPHGFRGSRHESLSETMLVLCSAAKNDDMAYVLMSQLNRDLEKRDDKRPTLADLRESGSIEEMARCVIGMYRGSLYGPPVAGFDYEEGRTPPSEEEWERTAELLVLKNTDGEEGVVHCQWDGSCTRID